MAKALEGQLSEANAKLDEATRTINDMNAQKSRLAAENNDLMRQVEEAESQVNQLTKVKSQLASQLEEAKSSVEDESRVRSSMFNNQISIFEVYTSRLSSLATHRFRSYPTKL